MNNSQPVILIAEDDTDDRLMIQEAFVENGMNYILHFVHDGQELLTYLDKQSGNGKNAMPDMIILDLNMPRKDGREALREIRSAPEWKHIPVVVLTTSKSPEDIRNSYTLGANCYITKPVTFESLMHMVHTFSKFWFDIVRLPSQ
jgi:CheY-like chemotaxis protein